MSINLDPEAVNGQSPPPPGRVTTILIVLLAVVIFVTATAVLLIMKQRSEAMALLRPTVTPGRLLTTATPAQPGKTPVATSPTVTGASGRATGTLPLSTATRQPGQLPLSPTVVSAAGSPTAAPSPTKAAPTVAARAWYFGEGASVPPFRTWYAILNPGNQATNVMLTLYPENGKPVQRNVAVAPGTQMRVLANEILPNAAFGAGITSDQPVYVERFTLGDRDGTTSSGLSPANTWYFPEGETADDFTVWLLVLNPGATPANLTVTYMIYRPEETTQPVVKKYVAPPTSRLTIDGRKDVPADVMGIMVESDQPVVVEQSLYFDNQKAAYGGGGATSLSTTWYVASANTQEGFTSRLAVLNPNKQPAVVKVTMIGSKSGRAQDSLSVPPLSKNDIVLNEDMDGQLVAAVLESDQPVAVVRATDYMSGGDNPVLAAYSAQASATAAGQWFLPETMTGSDYDSYVAIFNPATTPASATVTYYTDQGQPISKVYTVAPMTCLTIRVADDVTGKTVVAAGVSSTQPVVVERTTMFRRSVGASSSAGIPAR